MIHASLVTMDTATYVSWRKRINAWVVDTQYYPASDTYVVYVRGANGQILAHHVRLTS